MCGIAFFYNYHPTKAIDIDMVKELFFKLDARGGDASGWYFERIQGNKLITLSPRCALKAKDLWEEVYTNKDYKAGRFTGRERFIMLHTRKTTVGTEKVNANNHPIGSKNYVLIHNGHISSTRLTGYPYKGEVDSEEIVAYVETFGLQAGLRLLAGQLAIVLRHKSYKMFYLYRSGNPFHICYHRKSSLLFGASDDDYLPDLSDNTLHDRLIKGTCLHEDLPLDCLYEITTTGNQPQITMIDESLAIPYTETFVQKEKINKALAKLKLEKLQEN